MALDFLDPSVDVAPWAANYDPTADPYNYGTPSNSFFSGSDAGSVGGSGIGTSSDWLKVFTTTVGGYVGLESAKIKAQTPMYQRGPNGQLYREGVPVAGYQTAGAISPVMLLLLAGAAFLALR